MLSPAEAKMNSGEHQRAGQPRFRRAQHHHRPAALAVADHHRLRRVRAPRRHHAQELALGGDDVEDAPPRLRLAEEHDELDGVPAAQGDAHLAVRREAADARAVAGPRGDEEEGAALRVGAASPRAG
jgi:hypothetical protein